VSQRRAIVVLQIMVTRPFTVVAIEVIYGITGPLSPQRAKAVETITFIQLASTIVASLGCFFTERRFKANIGMSQQRAFAKLAVFKIIVILEAVQGTAFSFLAGNGTFLPSPPHYISWNDFAKGLPFLSNSCFVLLVSSGCMASNNTVRLVHSKRASEPLYCKHSQLISLRRLWPPSGTENLTLT